MDPFKLATWWVGMCLGIPMLATELAAEVWGTRPKPAPAPAEKAAVGMTRRVENIRTGFEGSGIEALRDEMVAALGAKLARSADPVARLKGQAMVLGVQAKRARKRKA